ncbi:MAG: hypothetical protein EWM73_03043 [Nitrospira sp.]|nr:MAG: hypothetical protein EWM73_03043 [Nitrospira sp.]
MRRFVHVAHGDLMRTPVIFGPLAIDLLRTGPAFGCPEHNHGPERPLLGTATTCGGFDTLNIPDNGIERRGHEPMHLSRIAAFDEIGDVAVAAEEMVQFAVTDTGQDSGIRDLVAVQMENGQYDAVGDRVEKFIGMPTRRERAGFRFTIAYDTGSNQVRVVEYGPVRMRE